MAFPFVKECIKFHAVGGDKLKAGERSKVPRKHRNSPGVVGTKLLLTMASFVYSIMASNACIISKQNMFTSVTSRECSCNFNPNLFLTPTMKDLHLLANISFMTVSCSSKEHSLLIQSCITFQSSCVLRAAGHCGTLFFLGT